MQFKKILYQIFRFLGSVRLAVPCMLIWMVVIAYGTIIESNYNADLARAKVYGHPIFSTLIALIWINILFAALSRWPWKKQQTGFLITHLGLLLLFGGGFATNMIGIDGLLRLEEGQSCAKVSTPSLVLKITSENGGTAVDYPMDRPLHTKDQAYFTGLNEKLKGLLTIETYEPFVQLKPVLKNAVSDQPEEPIHLKFRIQSQFFDVEQSLNSHDQPHIEMGPARFEVLPIQNRNKSAGAARADQIQYKLKGQEKFSALKIQKIPQDFTVGPYRIRLLHKFSRAYVAQGGLKENSDGPLNPAAEIEIQSGTDKAREVLFANFPDFSLLQGKFPNLSLRFVSSNFGPPAEFSGNLARFYYDLKQPDQVVVDLLKQGQVVASQNLKRDEIFQTPWMGMKLTLLDMQWGASLEDQVVPVTPEERSDILPPSAIKLNFFEGAPADEFWLIEGQQQRFSTNGINYEVFYGRKEIQLPYTVRLDRFNRLDYPGTNMAKSFSSQVQLSNRAEGNVISMNEPLQANSFTLYQSSFEDLGNGKFASIFSVNRDPGRPFKYLGGLLIAIGIITHTFLRSRRFKKGKTS